MEIKKPNPEEELIDNLNLISPIKKCPKCHALSLEFDPKTNKIKCMKCGFEVNLPK